MSDRVTLKIPRPLYEKLKQVIKGTVYVLRDLMSDLPAKEVPTLTEKEIEIVRDRLRKLGYL